MSNGEAVPLSLATETEAGRVLAAAAELLLQASGTSLEYDEALLLIGGMESREEVAVRFRISRKRVLQACRERCLAWVERPTVTGGTLRRPWKVHIRSSG
mmetsp:Transcript_215/g.438  ORF Transcript_215/g.438 Transcript_215/m.438 type:complete len:100 (+) Transcript_215:2-301(+)